jgi:hypothetical protein
MREATPPSNNSVALYLNRRLRSEVIHDLNAVNSTSGQAVFDSPSDAHRCRTLQVWTVCRSRIAGQLCSNHPKAMTQRGKDVSNICPKLTMNGQFIRDFIAAESPCFALGLVEERKQPCGFLALRSAEVIPPEISGLGFNFGHALLGTTEFEVIQFVFHFYGFETYNGTPQGPCEWRAQARHRSDVQVRRHGGPTCVLIVVQDSDVCHGNPRFNTGMCLRVFGRSRPASLVCGR